MYNVAHVTIHLIHIVAASAADSYMVSPHTYSTICGKFLNESFPVVHVIMYPIETLEVHIHFDPVRLLFHYYVHCKHNIMAKRLSPVPPMHKKATIHQLTTMLSTS